MTTMVPETEAPASVSPHAAQLGQVIDGKYRIESILGISGMGVVYLATHLEIDQSVAIKFLLHGAGDPAALARFRREARAMGKIRSEHAVRVIDVGQLDAKTPFIVMEYLEGRDLSALMKEMGKVTLAFAAEVLLQACEALAVAHVAGVIHRDLKPSNIFLTTQSDGAPHVKVIDFGVAKFRRSELDKSENVTHSSSLVGSPRYMAPEQIGGDSEALDQRVDVWALGIILQEMVTGQRVFRGEGVGQLLIAIATQPPADIAKQWPEAPAPLVALIRRTLQRNPEHRTADVGEFAEALAQFTPGGPARAARTTSALMASRPRLPNGALSSGRLPTVPEAPAEASPSGVSSPSGVLPAVASSVRLERASSSRRTVAIVAVAIGTIGLAGAAFAFVKHREDPQQTATGMVAAPTAAQPPPAAVDVAPSPTPDAINPLGQAALASAKAPAASASASAARKVIPTKPGAAPAKPPQATTGTPAIATKPRPDLFDDPK
jgi:serine/threonine-protein kinase